MKYYNYLSKLGFLNKYSYKFLFVSFLGIHVPLIGIILFILLGPGDVLEPATVIGLTLLLTLAATGVTLYILHQLIAPVRLVASAMHEYLNSQKLPSLPTHYKDEAGVLLHDVQLAVTELDLLLTEKKDLLEILSHDFRNPTLNVLQAISIIRNEKEPEDVESLYQIIEGSAKQQLDLIKSVTTLWRHGSKNATDINLQSVQLSQVVNEVLLQQNLLFNQKKLIMELEVPQDLQVSADPDLLREVVGNVVYNAIKFSRPGGTISIRTQEVDNKVNIIIKDQGIGFKQEQAEVLFQHFTPYRRKGTSGEETVGLGLYLCRKMLIRQGGSITAYSPGEGKGAEFTISLSKPDVS